MKSFTTVASAERPGALTRTAAAATFLLAGACACSCATAATADAGSNAATAAATHYYYVSPGGSDTAAGTEAAPFRTLARAARAVTRPGTTVFVAPGTYAGGFRTTASGTPSARIRWVSTTKWGAKIVPPAHSTRKKKGRR